MALQPIESVITSLWDEFPDLVGDKWPTLQFSILTYLEALKKPGANRSFVESMILKAFEPYPLALSRIKELRDRSPGQKAKHLTVEPIFIPDVELFPDPGPIIPSGLDVETEFGDLGGGGVIQSNPRGPGMDVGSGSGSGAGFPVGGFPGGGRMGGTGWVIPDRAPMQRERRHFVEVEGQPGTFINVPFEPVMPSLEESKVRSPMDVNPAGTARPTGASKFVVVPIFYGTDRAVGSPVDPEKAYQNDRGPDALQFGVAKVSIPDTHEIGQIEAPKHFLMIRFDSDVNRHITLTSVEPLERGAFMDRAKGTLGKASSREAFIFIHGYNVGFADAMRQTAQLAFDLRFPGLAMAYSWPSGGNVMSYTADEDTVQWTQPHFQDFLRTVRVDLGVTAVHVVAHSMGNRALVETLDRVRPGDLPEDAAPLANVVFAAPDVGSERFRQLAKRFQGKAGRFTLYASSKDEALAASQKFHGYPRAGDSGDGLVVLYPPIETVDATCVDTSLLGHSYIRGNRSVISDLFDMVRNNLSPNNRPEVHGANRGDLHYWAFVP